MHPVGHTAYLFSIYNRLFILEESYLQTALHTLTRESSEKQTDTFDYTYFEKRQGYIEIIILLIKFEISKMEMLKYCKTD